jgi:hypothetical protein
LIKPLKIKENRPGIDFQFSLAKIAQNTTSCGRRVRGTFEGRHFELARSDNPLRSLTTHVMARPKVSHDSGYWWENELLVQFRTKVEHLVDEVKPL